MPLLKRKVLNAVLAQLKEWKKSSLVEVHVEGKVKAFPFVCIYNH